MAKHLPAYTANLLIDLFPEQQHLKIRSRRLLLKLQMDPVFNYASQVWNHIFYFECLRPGSKIQ